MKLRSRLVLAFAYILVTIMIALGLPLAVTLEDRARSEFQTNLLVTAQAYAAVIGSRRLNTGDTAQLQQDVAQLGESLPVDARLILVDGLGRLVADSSETGDIGARYATSTRPEIQAALGRPPPPRPVTDVRYSSTLQEDLVVAAAPIFDQSPPDGGVGGRTRENPVAGAVRLSESLADVNRSIRRSTIGLIIIGLTGLAAGLLLAFALAASLARPLRRLAGTARRLGGGDLTARTENPGGADEIRDVAHSFDEMADRLEHSAQAQREFVANASHQLRTPLTGMKLRLESAIDQAGDDHVRTELEAAEREVDRLSEIVNRLLVMSRQIEAGEPTRVDVADAARRAIERWNDRATRAGAALALEATAGVAQANPTDVDQILDNLLDNAIAYAPGPITVRTATLNGRVVITVEDRGPGVAASEIERLTERFYRGPGSPRGGSGLGLAIARELAEKWGGSTRLSSPRDGGFRVEVDLRAAHDDGDAARRDAGPTDRPGSADVTDRRAAPT
jgi:two-component system, OmpR family, sensor kinase